MSKKTRWGIVGGLLLLALAVGGAVAYFTTQTSSQNFIVTTGGIAVEMTDVSDNGLLNLMPGEDKEIFFQLANTGDAPVYLKGRIDQAWSDPDLVGGLYGGPLSFFNGQNWVPLIMDGDEYYYSRDQALDRLTQINPDSSVQMKARIRADINMGDEFQNQTQDFSIHLAARQVWSNAQWPAEY